jgi:hypothetical protein
MNTLVGLMNEVFGDLKTHAKERDAKELNCIIYSLEIFLVLERFSGEPSHFIWSEYKEEQKNQKSS